MLLAEVRVHEHWRPQKKLIVWEWGFKKDHRFIKKCNWPTTFPTQATKLAFGCGTVGPQFESSLRQFLITINCTDNMKIKNKFAVNVPFKKLNHFNEFEAN